MTERLSQLLHDEASRLDVPSPPADAVLVRGRRMRRNRGLAVAGAAAAALAVIGGGVALASGADGDRVVEPAGAPTSDLAFSIGNDVYVGEDARRATVDDAAVKSLYYTSVGVLVRHGDNPYSDGGGPQRFSLVEPDGTVEPISVETEETVHSTDPEQPYLAYAETIDGTTSVVVHDLTDDTQEARIALPDGLKWGSWPAPPVALSGDQVYVGTSDAVRVVDWRSGEISVSDVLPPGYPEVAGGRSVTYEEPDLSVVDSRTGEQLLKLPPSGMSMGAASVSLSPDGRFVSVGSGSLVPSLTVYDLDERSHTTIEKAPEGFGWSPDGELFAIDGDELTTCSPTTGECETTTLALAASPSPAEGQVMKCDGAGKCKEVGPPPDFSGELKLGGRVYES